MNPATSDWSVLAGLPDWPLSPIDQAMQAWWQGAGGELATGTLAVALSGGADSTALLLAAMRLGLHGMQRKAGRVAPKRIVALHIHHGLQEAADAFDQHAGQLCAVLANIAHVHRQSLQHGQSGGVQAHASAHPLPDLHYAAHRVQVRPGRGDSLEAAARATRYAALADMAKANAASSVLLGHHADDQAESVLLALGRGAGVAGLAAMPAWFERHGVAFARPLLAVPGSAIRGWLQAQRIAWVDDPSNADHRFTRNKLRQLLMPAVEQVMPNYRSSLARSARLAAQADALLAELATEDLARTGAPPAIQPLRQLSRARQANVLRHWLKTGHGVIGSEAQLNALLDVIDACTTRGHRIHIKVGPGYVEHSGGQLRWQLVQ